MSDRGSFVTEYIYCDECFAAVQRVLCQGAQGPGLTARPIPTWDARMGAEPSLPIVAGKIAGLSKREELLVFEYEIAPKLSVAICHPLRVAVIAEHGQCIYQIWPSTKIEAAGEPDICESRPF